MAFNIIEGDYVDWDEIMDDFIDDYIHSTKLSNVEIREKYDLSWREFKDLSEHCKRMFGLTRRPTSPQKNGRHYYVGRNGYVVQKFLHGKLVYIGTVPTEEIAIKVVELCKNTGWDVVESKHICRNYECYI